MNDDVKNKLRQSWLLRQQDVRDIMDCRTAQDKRELVAKWKLERHPHTVTELLEIARNKVMWNKILAWDTERLSTGFKR